MSGDLDGRWSRPALLAVFAGVLLSSGAAAQDLPPAPVFDAQGAACGTGAVIYQPAGQSFVLGFDTAIPQGGFPRYRLHIDGSARGEVDASDALPIKIGPERTLEIGPGKEVGLTVGKVLYGRLRAYDAEGRESEPAPLALIPLATPGQPTISGAALSWQPTVLPSGVSPLPAVSYQVFRFACDTKSPCGTEPGLYLGEQSETSLPLDASVQYRYAIRAVARFTDGSPPVHSQPSLSPACVCDPLPESLTVTGINGQGTKQFVLPRPSTGAITLTVSGRLRWDASTNLSEVDPSGSPRSVCTQFGAEECLDDPLQDNNENHAAFYFRIGNGQNQVATASGNPVTFQLPALVQGAVIGLFVNDGNPGNNSGSGAPPGFTANLSYTSPASCSGE